jgi:predicted 3-demethylubiquinone-9 3-methyltransferase (glyoxalase superfamily)
MQKITPFLWFDSQAEEAANYYVSVFRNSKIRRTARYGDAGPGPKGSVMTVEFELDGNEFVALNGGPHYKITPAVSFVVNCKDQADVDYYWDKLTAGGMPVQCGWLTDKFGVLAGRADAAERAAGRSRQLQGTARDGRNDEDGQARCPDARAGRARSVSRTWRPARDGGWR